MSKAETALILLDLQSDFLGDQARMPVCRGQIAGLVDCVTTLIRFARGRFQVVYVGNEFSRWDYPAHWFRRHAAVQGGPGCQIDERIAVINDTYFAKHRASAFTNRAFAQFLEGTGTQSIALCGVFASFCVHSTCRSALRMGYRVSIIRDGVADRSDRSRDRALARMKCEGADIVTSQELITRQAE